MMCGFFCPSLRHTVRLVIISYIFRCFLGVGNDFFDSAVGGTLR
nr:MAG TPA: hypothetical protein [Caudoviricetes sp.]